MASDRYEVRLTRQAERDLRGLRSYAERVTRTLLSLEEDPERGHYLQHGTLQGVRSLEFSLPGGAYRAAYIVLEETQVCLVFMVGPHENFYREAGRRYIAWRRAQRATEAAGADLEETPPDTPQAEEDSDTQAGDASS